MKNKNHKLLTGKALAKAVTKSSMIKEGKIIEQTYAAHIDELFVTEADFRDSGMSIEADAVLDMIDTLNKRLSFLKGF